MLAARKDVWRERTSAISSPILPACSGCLTANLLSPQPVTLKSKCQPVTFWGVWLPFCFFPIHRWRWREPHLSLSVTYVYYGVSHSSLYFRVKARVKQLKLDMIIAILCHFLVPGYDFPALFSAFLKHTSGSIYCCRVSAESRWNCWQCASECTWCCTRSAEVTEVPGYVRGITHNIWQKFSVCWFVKTIIIIPNSSFMCWKRLARIIKNLHETRVNS